MGLQADILRTEIEKLKREKMTENVAYKLSIYWSALQAVQDEEYNKNTETVQEFSESQLAIDKQELSKKNGTFFDIVKNKPVIDVYTILQQHFDILSAIAPEHYQAVIQALNDI